MRISYSTKATTHGLQTALPSPATSTIAAPSQPAASPTTQRTDPGETQTTETQTDDRARSPEHPTVDTTDTPRRLRVSHRFDYEHSCENLILYEDHYPRPPNRSSCSSH